MKSSKQVRTMNLHSQEAQQIPRKIKLKKMAPRHLIIQLLKSRGKNKIVKANKGKNDYLHAGTETLE